MHRLRLLCVFIICFFTRHKNKDPLGVFELTFHVTPFDVEVTRQFTQNYFSMMALARWHYILQNIKIKEAVKERWGPMTYSEHIRYHRSLKLFHKVKLRTRLVYWNENKAYFRHEFVRKGRLIALGLSCGAMYGVKGYVSPITSIEANIPDLENTPNEVLIWESLDDELNKSLK